VTDDKLSSLVAAEIISEEQASGFVELLDQKYISVTKFERILEEKFTETATERIVEEKLPVLVTTFTQKGLTARLFTFIVALVTAVLTTYLIPRKEYIL